jgi:hypothetical protein
MIPCPDCCPSCVIGTDTFAGDLSAFTETGSPTISSGILQLGAGDGVTHDTAAAGVGDAVRTYFTITTSPTNGTIRAEIAKSDSSNLLYGEVIKTGSTWEIVVGHRVGGTDTEYTSVVELSGAPSNPIIVCLSWEPGETQTPESFDTGGHYPNTATDSGWTNSSNILLDDGNSATHFLPASTTSGQLAALDFRFPLPPGSTIDGILVVIQARAATASNTIQIWEVQLYNKDGNAVGDVKVQTGQLTTTMANYTFGGDTDNWNAGLAWDDFLSTVSGVRMLFRNVNPISIDTVSVDVVLMELWFTTPERTPGRLRLSINGECVTEYSAENPDDGLLAGVRSVAGDWEIDDWNYEYLQSASRPNCGVCACDTEDAEPCPCCDDGFPAAAEYVIDLGAGGWTDSTCSFCDDVAGEFLLTSASSCVWSYTDEIACPDNGGGNCYPRIIVMSLTLVTSGETCKWVFRMSGPGVCDPADNQLSFLAVYESGDMSSGEDCQSLPVTLNKVTDTNAVCGGALPATITLEAA